MSSQAALNDSFTACALKTAPVRQSGAYAFIEDDAGRVLTVQAENGRFYLPGGRIEPGETARQALAREIAEECGWTAALLGPLHQGSQSIMGGAVLLQARHWRARLVTRLDSVPEHRLVWASRDEALGCLHRDCDRQAVRKAAAPRPLEQPKR